MFRPPIFLRGDSDGYKNFLEEHGYVVIGNILPEDVRKDLTEQFWKDWTTCSPGFDRDDKSTWSNENSPMMYAKGMALFSGLPHSDFAWSTRTRPEIREVFEQIHGTSKLVVSFDGFSVFFDPKQKTKPWWHTDQDPDGTELSIQGQYNFLPVAEDSAGFTVVPGSHKIRSEKNGGKDWVPVTTGVTGGVKLLIPENCLILWNSKTVHANTGMTCKSKRFDRLTCYITYMPSKTRSKDTHLKKIMAYLNSEGTSHWANRCEIKKYPWGFGPLYESRGFHRIKTTRDIPMERLSVF